jgi:hypothetical protein
MILNVIFHGAWGFFIDEVNNKILAITPDETGDHHYQVGSFYQQKWVNLPEHDFTLVGIQGSTTPVIPAKQLSPVISAKKEQIRMLDPTETRYCYISMPMPLQIIPLEPYIIGNFLKGTAALQLQGLKQFPAVQCFIFECNSLDDLQFLAIKSNETISPDIKENDSPNEDTANLHVLAAYLTPKSKMKNHKNVKEDTDIEDKEQMERCFGDLALFFAGLNFGLKLPQDYDKQVLKQKYECPRGVTEDEVELKTYSPRWAKGSNCQNTQFFINETSGVDLSSLTLK